MADDMREACGRSNAATDLDLTQKGWTSAQIKTYELPGGGFCNDIALKGADAYVTDTKGGRVLKLASGSDALSVWYTNDAADPSLDGLVWQGESLFTSVSRRASISPWRACNQPITAGGAVMSWSMPQPMPRLTQAATHRSIGLHD